MAGGAYIALTGLRSRMEQIDRLAADIANVGTAGYKAERVTHVAVDRPDFNQVLESAIDVAAGPGQGSISGRAEFIALVKKYDTGRYRNQGKYHVANLPFQDAAKFARLATKFGFKKQAEGNVKGYTIVQGGTSDYTFADRVNGKSVTVGFFTGFTPEMFEKRLVEDVYGKDASDKMTDLERRKAYFKELGVDVTGITDAKLSNSKLLYKDKNFFNTKFYPAFKTKFGEADYRPEMGSIGQIGAEHYDGYRSIVKPKQTDTTVIGYKCTGRDANGKATIENRSYLSTQEIGRPALQAQSGVISISTQRLMEACTNHHEKDNESHRVHTVRPTRCSSAQGS